MALRLLVRTGSVIQSGGGWVIKTINGVYLGLCPYPHV